MKGVVSCADPAKGAINFDQIGSVWTDQANLILHTVTSARLLS